MQKIKKKHLDDKYHYPFSQETLNMTELSGALFNLYLWIKIYIFQIKAMNDIAITRENEITMWVQRVKISNK